MVTEGQSLGHTEALGQALPRAGRRGSCPEELAPSRLPAGHLGCGQWPTILGVFPQWFHSDVSSP